jgi:hypothetical protein
VVASFLGQTTELALLANAQVPNAKEKLGPVPTGMLYGCGISMISALLGIACYGLWKGPLTLILFLFTK